VVVRVVLVVVEILVVDRVPVVVMLPGDVVALFSAIYR